MRAERHIEIETPKGAFRVWTCRVGEHPTKKLLLLHGGPGATHEGFEIFEQYLPADGIEFYYYDQLGSYRSDQPDEPELWTVPRFVDEVEQVRSALDLDADNFYLLGQSWGGLLAIEYALAHQENLKGLVISNMMSSAPAYGAYAEKVLMPSMDPAHMAWMADQLPNGRSLICPNGSHLAQYDDPNHYFPGLIRFIDEVDDNRRAME